MCTKAEPTHAKAQPTHAKADPMHARLNSMHAKGRPYAYHWYYQGRAHADQGRADLMAYNTTTTKGTKTHRDVCNN